MSKIEFIKIYGERNSGTNYVNQLLKANLKQVTFLDHKHERRGYWSDWKHGLPNIKNKNVNKTLFICIIRDLEPWLISFFRRPYHLKRKEKFQDFLLEKQNIRTTYQNIKIRPKRLVNFDDVGKDIFEIRYHKINSYLRLFSDAKYVMFVNLDFLQKNGGLNLVHFLSSEYGCKIKDNPNDIDTHTKTKKIEKNQPSQLNIGQFNNILKRKKNIEIENFVNSLKSGYKYKN